jgi:hypothetical protein
VEPGGTWGNVFPEGGEEAQDGGFHSDGVQRVLAAVFPDHPGKSFFNGGNVADPGFQ